MHFATTRWLSSVGFLVFAAALLMAVSPANAVDQNALRADSGQQSAATNVRVVGSILDDQIQQTAHTSSVRKTSPANSRRSSGVLFEGFELRLPKMPFSRGSESRRSTATQRPPSNRAATSIPPHIGTPRAASRLSAAQQNQPSKRSTLRAVSGNSAPAPASRSSVQSARRNQPATQASSQPTFARANQGVASAGLQARESQPQLRITVSETDSPTDLAAATSATPPESAANRLMLQAHQLSRGAKTIDDFTCIIETCRRTQASQPTEPVSRYASELAGWALNRRGQLKADAGQLREAMLDFDDAIRADANCWRAIHNRGVLLAQSGQFEKAFDEFNRTIQINAEFAKAYSNRAALFVVAGDLLPALADYQRAIELDPDLAVAHRGRGRVCHLLGRLDEAISHYDAAVQLTPDDAYAISSRADLLTDLGRYKDAARDYQRSIQLDPNSPDAYRGLAWLMATCPDGTVRDASRAIELAEHALTLDDRQEPVGFDTLAAAQANAGDFAAAMQTLHKAIKNAPDAERTVYQDRLVLYQHAKPFRITPVRPVTQASYQSQ